MGIHVSERIPAMIYLYSHQKMNPEMLAQWVTEHNAIVIDTRARTTTRDKRWQKSVLQPLFGARYLHLPRLLDADAPEDRVTRFKTILRDQPVVLMTTIRDTDQQVREQLDALFGDEVVELNLLPQVRPDDQRGRLYTVDEAAEYLAVPKSQLEYQLYFTGNLKHYGALRGGRWFFSEDALNTFREAVLAQSA